MSPTRPVLRYHGGKWMLANWIIGHFPLHRVYVEPFGGAGSVLMRKPRCYSEVYNDRWSVVVDVFRVLRDPALAAELERRIRLTPFSRAEFDTCGDADIARIRDPIERARRAIIRSFMGFGSASTNARHSTGFRANANKNGGTPAHDWAAYPDHIAGFAERLRGVIIENRPAIEVIRQQDSCETLHYLDPPYPVATRNMRRGNASYAHEMNDDDHRELAEVLHSVRGMVILSGYSCDLYDRELYPEWGRVHRTALADGARERVEVLWLNPAAARKQPQPSLFDSLLAP